MRKHNVLSTDLETTGTNEGDEITTIGFVREKQSSDWLNMDLAFYFITNQNTNCGDIKENEIAESIEQHADVRTADVNLYSCTSEAELIRESNKVLQRAYF
jgi:hypothetical protein